MSVRYHVAVRRPTDDRLLVLRDGALPGFALEVAPSWPEVTPVVDAMRALGLEVVALRAAWVDDPRLTVAGGSDRLYEVAYVGGSPPEGADWIPLEASNAGRRRSDRPSTRGCWSRPRGRTSRGIAPTGHRT